MIGIVSLLVVLTICETKASSAWLDIRDGADPLLTLLSKDSDLSQFSKIISDTGGSSATAGPPFEERFNNALDGRRFTIFAPVNSAFSSIPPSVLKILTSPQSYPLLEALLRMHIADGEVTQSNVTNGGSVRSVEGFALSFNSSTFGSVALNGQARLISNSPAPAANGAVFKIDAFVDPFVNYFGRDNAAAAAAPRPVVEVAALPDCSGVNKSTMADVLANTPQLSSFRQMLEVVAPEFAAMLDMLPKKDGNNSSRTVLFAPSNAAFDRLPPGSVEMATQPSNQPLTAWLLKSHLARVRNESDAESVLGLPLRVIGAAGNFTAVNNAAVEGEGVCACNGCVYVVSRWLDPVFGRFGWIDQVLFEVVKGN